MPRSDGRQDIINGGRKTGGIPRRAFGSEEVGRPRTAYRQYPGVPPEGRESVDCGRLLSARRHPQGRSGRVDTMDHSFGHPVTSIHVRCRKPSIRRDARVSEEGGERTRGADA